MQHAEVERHRQQRVRHGPVLAHDGVLVAAKVGGEPVFDESREHASGFGRGGDGEQAGGTVDADGVEVHGVEVATHLVVDVVLPRLVGLGQAERLLLLRRGFAVVLVVVPPVADGFAAVHQHVEAATLIAVEVLHAEAGAITGPLLKVLARQREHGCRQHLGDEALLLQSVDEPLGGVRGRLVDQDGGRPNCSRASE